MTEFESVKEVDWQAHTTMMHTRSSNGNRVLQLKYHLPRCHFVLGGVLVGYLWGQAKKRPKKAVRCICNRERSTAAGGSQPIANTHSQRLESASSKPMQEGIGADEAERRPKAARLRKNDCTRDVSNVTKEL